MPSIIKIWIQQLTIGLSRWTEVCELDLAPQMSNIFARSLIFYDDFTFLIGDQRHRYCFVKCTNLEIFTNFKFTHSWARMLIIRESLIFRICSKIFLIYKVGATRRTGIVFRMDFPFSILFETTSVSLNMCLVLQLTLYCENTTRKCKPFRFYGVGYYLTRLFTYTNTN